jgi:hypothetical protein
LGSVDTNLISCHDLKIKLILWQEIMNIKIKTAGITWLKEFMGRAAEAINTPLLPTGFSTEAEFIAEVIKIQLGRRFSEGHSEADLKLMVADHYTELIYCSTSGTSVEVLIARYGDQLIKNIQIDIYLDADRCEPGRCHYETLSRAFNPSNSENRDGWPTITLDYEGAEEPEWIALDAYWTEMGQDKIKEWMDTNGYELTKTPLGNYWLNSRLGVGIVIRENDRMRCNLHLADGYWLACRDKLEEIDDKFIVEQIKKMQGRNHRRSSLASDAAKGDEYEDYPEEDSEEADG